MFSKPLFWALGVILLIRGSSRGFAQGGTAFILPTPNRALFEANGESRYFVGTVGKPWTSGTFGCVRSDGRQIHEGLDIKATRRDKNGDPSDPIYATADGSVAYFNSRAALSNYGRYIILRHQVEGIEIYSVYAHLSEISDDLSVGSKVRQGQTIATMGRSSNTRQTITKDRAHLHFELNVLLNDRFGSWFQDRKRGERNDHGNWNGHNLLGLDPRKILLEQARQGSQFSLLTFIRKSTLLCRVQVKATRFPYARRYQPLIRRNFATDTEGVAGYEIALDFNGVPFELLPKTRRELGDWPGKTRIISVNEEEHDKNSARHLISRQGSRWDLTSRGQELLDLLTY